MKLSIQPITRKLAALTFTTSFLLMWNMCPASAQNYSATILSNKPAAYYEMQEAPGASTAIDSSGNGFNGSIDYDASDAGTNDYPLPGLPGVDTNAYLFHDYDDDYFEAHVSDIDVGYNSTMNPQGPFSAECWVRATSDNNGSYDTVANYDAVMGSVSGSYPQPGWVIYQTPGTSGGEGSWALDCLDGTIYLQAGQVVKNQWTHLVAVYDGTDFTFYVNGVSAGTSSGVGYVASTGDFYIGGQPVAANGSFDGYITQVAIYTNALTAAQVLNDYMVGTNSFSTNAEPPEVLVDDGVTNTDPTSITVNAGNTATFDPIVVGSLPLSYQWYSNGIPITGATSSLLSFVASSAANGATFDVVVTNNYGSVTSQVATLTVNSILVINSDPMSIVRNVGGYAAFHVTASGAAPITYQWSVSSNGGSTFSPIAGATSETLWLSDIQSAESGNEYSVLVKAPGNSTNVPPATLTVQANPTPVSLTGYETLVAAAKPVAFWPLNDANGSGTAVDAADGNFDGTYTPALGSIVYDVTGGVPGDTNAAVGLNLVLGETNGASVQVPWAPELNPDTPWSVETWVQPASLGSSGGDYRLVLSSEYNQYPYPYNGWYIYQQPNNTFAFVPQPGGGFTSGGSIVAGNWYHLVVTDDGTNFNLYINGVLAVAPTPVASSDFIPNGDGILPTGAPAIGSSGDDGANFVMGQRTDGAFNTFQGNMQDTALYNYALTPQQIVTHYLNQVTLTIAELGTNAVVSWPNGTGTLQESTKVTGPYTDIGGAAPPYTNSMGGSTMFYRLLRQ